MSARILVVEDEPDIQELIRYHLDQAGFHVETASRGDAALQALRRRRPSLIVLDLMLPDRSGTELCRDIRSDPDLKDLPVIMVTARSDEVDRLLGFELGADDYVVKPFSPRELTLRIRAVLRRGAREDTHSPELLQHGDLTLDVARHRCQLGDLRIDLTAKEFELLRMLMARPGRVMNRERLLDEIWGPDVTVTLRTIDTHMKRLREKLGPAGDLIHTIRGVGYRFEE
jgi:two-component system, OmpR family, phosphate regulon response regulator PhoB